MSYRPRDCEVCMSSFTPPHRANSLSTDDNHTRLCAACRRNVKAIGAGELPAVDGPTQHYLAAPMRQLVFDLETWGLDRGWGVTLVYSRLLHGGPKGPEKLTLTARDFAPWKKGIRSNDRDFVADVIEDLYQGNLIYAHNGERFDVRWLRTVALRYGFDMPKTKLVDPCAIAWRKYLVGRNSLEALADFLRPRFPNLAWDKMHVPVDIWRQALMDNDDESWKMLIKRCESDVEVLNSVASCVSGDVGMIDNIGSFR